MTRLLEIGLSNALMATLLAVIVAIVARVVRRPALVHALWVLVLVKLVTAPMLGVPVGFGVAFDSPEPETPAVAAVDATIEATPVATPPTTEPRAVGPTERPRTVVARAKAEHEPRSVDRRPATVRNEPRRSRTRGADEDPIVANVPVADSRSTALVTSWTWPRLTPAFVIGVIWGAGTLFVVAVQFLAIARCSRFLGHGGRAMDDLQREAEAVAAELGLARCPRIWIVSTTLSPMLYALGPFARIVLPSPLLRDVDDNTRRLLLAHELAHYQRGDHWVRLLETVAVAIFWWHPVVWWARREIHETEEACCDALVVEHVSRAPRPYAEALLDTVDFLSRAPSAVPVASGLGSADSIRRRLTAIMQRNVATRVDPGAWWAVVVFGAIVLPLTPTEFGVPTPTLAAPSAGTLDTEAVSVRGDERRPGVMVPVPFQPRGSFADLLGEPPRVVQPSEWAVIHSPDGSLTITATTDQRLRFEHDGTEIDLTEERVTGVAFPAVSDFFVTAHWDGTLSVRDSATADRLATVHAHEAIVRSLAFDPTGGRLVSGAADGTLRAWELAEEGGSWSLVPVGDAVDVGRPVNCVRFAPDGTSVFVGLGDWRSPHTGRVVVLPIAGTSGLASIETAPVDLETSVAAIWFDEERALIGEWNGTVTVLDVSTGEVLDVGRAAKDAIAAASFSARAVRPEFVPAPIVVEPGFPAGMEFGPDGYLYVPALNGTEVFDEAAYELPAYRGVESLGPTIPRD